MNVLIHLGATGALFWLALYAFDDLSEGVLGVAVLALAFAFLIMTIIALAEDKAAVKRVRKGDDDE